VNIYRKARTNNIDVLINRHPLQIVDNQLNTLIPVGIAMIVVTALK